MNGEEMSVLHLIHQDVKLTQQQVADLNQKVTDQIGKVHDRVNESQTKEDARQEMSQEREDRKAGDSRIWKTMTTLQGLIATALGTAVALLRGE